MTRTATGRPPGEYHAVLSRIFRQVGVDQRMKAPRRKKILEHLSAAMTELQAEIGK